MNHYIMKRSRANYNYIVLLANYRDTPLLINSNLNLNISLKDYNYFKDRTIHILKYDY